MEDADGASDQIQNGDGQVHGGEDGQMACCLEDILTITPYMTELQLQNRDRELKGYRETDLYRQKP